MSTPDASSCLHVGIPPTGACKGMGRRHPLRGIGVPRLRGGLGLGRGCGAAGTSVELVSPTGTGGGTAAVVAFRMASLPTMAVASSKGLPGSDE